MLLKLVRGGVAVAKAASPALASIDRPTGRSATVFIIRQAKHHIRAKQSVFVNSVLRFLVRLARGTWNIATWRRVVHRVPQSRNSKLMAHDRKSVEKMQCDRFNDFKICT